MHKIDDLILLYDRLRTKNALLSEDLTSRKKYLNKIGTRIRDDYTCCLMMLQYRSIGAEIHAVREAIRQHPEASEAFYERVHKSFTGAALSAQERRAVQLLREEIGNERFTAIMNQAYAETYGLEIRKKETDENGEIHGA